MLGRGPGRGQEMEGKSRDKTGFPECDRHFWLSLVTGFVLL